MSDLDALCVLDRSCFDTPWSREALAEELRHSDALCLGCFADPEEGMVAAVLTRKIADERWIFRIMTRLENRRQGLAEQLIGALPNEPLLLEVSVLNIGAIRFYESVGFKVVGKRPGYYPEDALVMLRQ